MTTAFAATEVVERQVIGPGLAYGVYQLQLPDSWTEAGVAWDLSAYGFTTLYSVSFGTSDEIADHGYKFDTIVSAAASVKIVAHFAEATDDTVFNAVPNTTDLSAINDITVIVFGD